MLEIFFFRFAASFFSIKYGHEFFSLVMKSPFGHETFWIQILVMKFFTVMNSNSGHEIFFRHEFKFWSWNFSPSWITTSWRHEIYSLRHEFYSIRHESIHLVLVMKYFTVMNHIWLWNNSPSWFTTTRHEIHSMRHDMYFLRHASSHFIQMWHEAVSWMVRGWPSLFAHFHVLPTALTRALSPPMHGTFVMVVMKLCHQ